MLSRAATTNRPGLVLVLAGLVVVVLLVVVVVLDLRRVSLAVAAVLVVTARVKPSMPHSNAANMITKLRIALWQ